MNSTLGPRYAVRISDLRSWHELRVTCFKCKHVGTVAPRLLRRHWHDSMRLIDLEERMRCTACGNRGNNSWNVVRLER